MSEKNETDELTFSERLELIKAVNGLQGPQKIPDDDQTYAIFTSGDYADREFRRVPRPSYRQRKAVEEVRLRSKVVSESVKEAICEELGWELAEKAAEELSMMDMHKQILPLIVREELPEGWDIEDVNSHEASRMLHDFLLGT